MGWEANRETQRGAGRTDILLSRGGQNMESIVEVKIWGRNDYKEIESQVCAYAQPDTGSLFCFMVAGSAVSDADYAQAVLSSLVPPANSTPDITQWSMPATDGRPPLMHFLVRLPGR